MEEMYYFPDIRVRKDTKLDSKYDWYEVVSAATIYGAIDEIIIPVGFVTDFASVPRWLWFIIPPFGIAMPAAVLHDYMYTTQHLQDMLGEKAARYYADDLFLRNLREVPGMKEWQAKSMFLTVRYFGRGHWLRKGNTTKS